MSNAKMRVPKVNLVCSFTKERFGIREHSFVVMKADSGFGKTMLLANYANGYEGEVFWYQLGEEDNENPFFRDSLEKLLEQIEEAKNREQTLVIFDGLEHIKNETSQNLLQGVVERLEQMHVVFSTNQEVPQWLVSLLLDRQGLLLKEQKLRLLEVDIPWENYACPEEGKQLLEAVCGWPLGFSYLIHEYQSKEQVDEAWYLAHAFDNPLLFEYLEQMIWEKSTKEEQEFLAMTSLLEYFSWEICKQVLPDNIKQITYQRLLVNKALFSKREDGYYQYGMVYRLYFQSMMDDKEKQEIFKRAAVYYLNQKQYRQAVSYAISGNQTYFLNNCLAQYGEELLKEDEQTTLALMIPFLEKSRERLLPEGCGVVAQYYYCRKDYVAMEWYFNEADSHFGKENKYSSYRSLYQALICFEEAPDKYEKQIHNALFFLRENQIELPYLLEKEQNCLDGVLNHNREEEVTSGKLLVKAMGTFQVIVKEDQKELSWRTRKGMELFAYLVHNNGKPAERKKLISVLWHNEIPQNAVSMLHNMLYNIRKELSGYQLEGIISYKNKHYNIDVSVIESDVSKILEIQPLIEKGQMEALWGHRKMFQTYWGRYLEDIDNYWVRETQDYFDSLYKKGCDLLAQKAVELGLVSEAVQYYRNILFIDPYSEQYMQKLLVVYGENKNWKQLKEEYKNFEKLLKADLGITPGEDLVKTCQRYSITS